MRPFNFRPYPTHPPHTVTGDLRWARRVAVPQLGVRRTVSLWLPPGYDESETRYPVLYMFDGQNLFDAARSAYGAEWCVDETMTALAAEGLPAIVVALDHGGERRIAEYTPFRSGRGRETLAYYAETLKPRIDEQFRTLPAREHTLIAGSSMGGLMSLYAAITRPDVYGAAGAFSPALWPERRAIFGVVRHAGSLPVQIYLDNGSEPSARPMAALLRDLGWRDGESLHYVYDRGAKHNETAWAARFPAAMRWLLAGRA